MWHDFCHTRASRAFKPRIYFTPRSRWDDANPWQLLPGERCSRFDPQEAGALFLAGMDWRALPETWRESQPVPVINLIQHTRHADPKLPFYRFLRYPALRICVSPEVAEAISATAHVNGPIVTIPNGLDWEALPAPPSWEERPIDLLIVALKRPELGRRLYTQLPRRWRAVLLVDWIPRPAFLERLAHSRVALFLPNPAEGFYLPALEGMALKTLVVCPDCIGNRSFCLPGETCLRPEDQLDALLAAAEEALSLKPPRRREILQQAYRKAREHDLERERHAFLKILDGLA